MGLAHLCGPYPFMMNRDDDMARQKADILRRFASNMCTAAIKWSITRFPKLDFAELEAPIRGSAAHRVLGNMPTRSHHVRLRAKRGIGAVVSRQGLDGSTDSREPAKCVS